MSRTPEAVIIDPDLGSRADVKRALTLARFSVSGEAGYGIEAVSVAKEAMPDVFLVNVEEPVVRALQTIEALGDAVPDSAAIVYSTLADAASVRRRAPRWSGARALPAPRRSPGRRRAWPLWPPRSPRCRSPLPPTP